MRDECEGPSDIKDMDTRKNRLNKRHGFKGQSDIKEMNIRDNHIETRV